jgi:hypothetical protein
VLDPGTDRDLDLDRDSHRDPDLDFEAILGDRPSRRAFLRASGVAVVGGSAVFLAACAGGKSAKSPIIAPSSGLDPTAIRADVDILQNALDLEHTVIAAYTAGLPLLTGTAHAAGRQFLAQEFAHASKLSSLVSGVGAKPNPPSPSYNLGHPRRATDVLKLLHMLERTMISAYVDAIPKLSPGSLRSIIASILANEAEHIAIVRASLGMPPVPSAFVTGSA